MDTKCQKADYDPIISHLRRAAYLKPDSGLAHHGEVQITWLHDRVFAPSLCLLLPFESFRPELPGGTVG